MRFVRVKRRHIIPNYGDTYSLRAANRIKSSRQSNHILPSLIIVFIVVHFVTRRTAESQCVVWVWRTGSSPRDQQKSTKNDKVACLPPCIARTLLWIIIIVIVVKSVWLSSALIQNNTRQSFRFGLWLWSPIVGAAAKNDSIISTLLL